MEYYFYLILFISIVSFVGYVLGVLNNNITKGNQISAVVSFASIILLQSVRKSTVGVDIVTYLMFFKKLIDGSVKDFLFEFYTIEPGFLLFNKAIALFTEDSQIFLTIVSACIFIPIGYVIYKNSLNLYLSIIALITLGFFNFTFSGIRQSIAIGIVFLSFEFIKKRKWIWFVLIVLLASTFHKSALVFLFAYPLYFLKINKKHYLLIVVLIAVVSLFKSFFLKFVISTAFEKYDNSKLLVSTGAYTMFFIMLLIYSLSIFLRRKKETSLSSNALSNYMLMSVFIQMAASESQVAMRAGYYYFIFVTLLLPEMTRTSKNLNVRKGVNFIVVVLCLAFYYLTTVDSTLNPYLFFWE
jgi:hypothetical protein